MHKSIYILLKWNDAIENVLLIDLYLHIFSCVLVSWGGGVFSFTSASTNLDFLQVNAFYYISAVKYLKTLLFFN